jgi:ferredoxin-NADP reductase
VSVAEAHPAPAGDPAGRFLGELPLYDSDRDEVLVCRQVRQETHDVKTFVFSAPEPSRFDYRPGQFLTFEFEIAGSIINRCYTIASAPTRPANVSITVKRVPGGPVSNWLHETMRLGTSVKAAGPMGDFTCLDHPAEKYLFVSGGSGITPLMSMARTFHDLAEPRDIVFVHAARTPADIIFRNELDLVARNMPSFRFVPICETDSPAERWHGLSGRLTPEMLRLAVPDAVERTVFTCGPAPFMAAVKGMLADAGHDRTHYFEESFSFEDLAPAIVDEVLSEEAPATRSFTIEFAKSRRTITCPEDMSILTAAKIAGLRLPSSCTQGMCGTCKSKKLSGTVEMTHQGGIRQREIDQGMVLICCSKPRSDIVLER